MDEALDALLKEAEFFDLGFSGFILSALNGHGSIMKHLCQAAETEVPLMSYFGNLLDCPKVQCEVGM